MPPKRKARRKKRKRSGPPKAQPAHLAQPLHCSPELSLLLSESKHAAMRLTRGEATKAIWAYAKEKGIQNGREVRGAAVVTPPLPPPPTPRRHRWPWIAAHPMANLAHDHPYLDPVQRRDVRRIRVPRALLRHLGRRPGAHAAEHAIRITDLVARSGHRRRVDGYRPAHDRYAPAQVNLNLTKCREEPRLHSVPSVHAGAGATFGRRSTTATSHRPNAGAPRPSARPLPVQPPHRNAKNRLKPTNLDCVDHSSVSSFADSCLSPRTAPSPSTAPGRLAPC